MISLKNFSCVDVGVIRMFGSSLVNVPLGLNSPFFIEFTDMVQVDSKGIIVS